MSEDDFAAIMRERIREALELNAKLDAELAEAQTPLALLRHGAHRRKAFREEHLDRPCPPGSWRDFEEPLVCLVHGTERCAHDATENGAPELDLSLKAALTEPK